MSEDTDFQPGTPRPCAMLGLGITMGIALGVALGSAMSNVAQARR